MRRLLIAVVVAVSVGTEAYSQILHESFDAGIPNNWQQAGSIGAVDVAQRGKAIQLSGAGATLTSPPATDAGQLTFWLRAPQPGDNYTLVVEAAPINDPDQKKWSVITSIEQTGPSSGAGDDRFGARIQHIGALNTSYIRWRISDYKSGAAVIDDVDLLAMSAAERAAAQQRELEATARRIFTETSQIASYDDAKHAFDNSADQYKRHLTVLLALRQRTSGIASLLETAGAVASRSEMANPLNYDTFTRIRDDLNGVLPDVKKERLADISESIKGVFAESSQRMTRLRTVASGIANVAVTVGSAFTGVNLRGILDNFKSLLADGYSPNNLDAVFPPGSFRDHSAKAITAMNKGVNDYLAARDFITGVLQDNERVTQLNSELTAARGDAETLNAAVKAYLQEYLSMVGASEKEIQLLQSSPTSDASSVTARADTFMAKALGDRNAWQGLSAQHGATLRDFETSYRRVDDFQLQYKHVVDGALEYYADFQQDLELGPPFKDEHTRQLWLAKKATTATLLKQARDNFGVSFGTP